MLRSGEAGATVVALLQWGWRSSPARAMLDLFRRNDARPRLIPNAFPMAREPRPGASRHPNPKRPPQTNRLAAYLGQLQDYWFHGPQRRFARDAGVSESTLSRLLRGETNPRYADICKIVALLERKLGHRIDPRDVYEP